MRSRPCLSLLVLGALALACLTTTPAAAQSKTDQDAASQLKKRGDDAFLGLKYADALKAYEASYERVKNPALHFNRGRALEALERFPEAIDAFEAFLREAGPELRAKTPKLDAHVTELKEKISTVTFNVAPRGARILVRGVALGTAPLSKPVRLRAGTAAIEVEAEGHVTYTSEHILPGGREHTLTVRLDRRAGSPAPAAAVSPAQEGDAPKSKSVFGRWWFWTGAAVLVAGAATAVVVIAAQPAKPREGDLGQLSAPLLRF